MSKELDALVKKANDALSEAMAYADRHGESFGFYPAYGMGGYYYPRKKYTREEALELLQSTKTLSSEDREEIALALNSEESYRETGWVSSSQNC